MDTRQKQISTLLSKEVVNRNKQRIEKLSTSDFKELDPFYKSQPTSGKLQASDISAVKQKIIIPGGYRSVRFYNCRPNASLGTIIVCGVSVMGGAFKTVSSKSSIFTVESVEIPLDASRTNGELYFQVGDANGGTGSWEFVK